MTTWDKLKERVVEALGEYDNQAVAGTSSRSYSDTTIEQRLEEKYGQLILDAARTNPRRFVATPATLAYAADSESVALSGASASVRWRPWVRVEDYTDSENPVTLEEMTPDEYADWREGYNYSIAEVAGTYRFRYYVEGPNIFLSPRPNQAVTLRIHYIAEPDSYTAGANSPQAFPAEYHPLIALEAAVSFMAQYGSPSWVENERQELKRRFMSWAATRETRGPRFVRGRSL